MSSLADRASKLWEFTEAELGKYHDNNTNFAICLVLAAALIDLYDSGIVPDSDGANGPENTNTPERDVAAMIVRLEKEKWR